MPQPLIVDSGAAETVMPSEWFPQHEVLESQGSSEGRFYTTADGTPVYNEGEKQLRICSLDGQQERGMTFQIAAVNKALGSASKLVKNGNRIVMDMDDSGRDIAYIENKRTKEKMWMRQRNGVYVLDILVAPPGHKMQGGTGRPDDKGKGQEQQQQIQRQPMRNNHNKQEASDFVRQGRQ